jgi:hypothetical protein
MSRIPAGPEKQETASPPDLEASTVPREPTGFRERVAKKMIASGRLRSRPVTWPVGLGQNDRDWIAPNILAELDARARGERGHHELPLAIKQELVRDLLATVGGVTDRNGMETKWRFARPTDPGLTPEQTWAAHILFAEGFWEATVAEAAASEGRPYPPSRRMVGAERLSDFRKEMAELASKPNPTDGADHLSRRGHALAAMEHLAAVGKLETQLIQRLRQPKYDPDRREIAHWFTDAVVHALDAGQRGHAARMKEWEPLAVSGRKQRSGAASGAKFHQQDEE